MFSDLVGIAISPKGSYFCLKITGLVSAGQRNGKKVLFSFHLKAF
jgi:hypothetical protein